MKPIEERAKEYSLKDFDGYYTGREKQLKKAILPGQPNKKQLTLKRLASGLIITLWRQATQMIGCEIHQI